MRYAAIDEFEVCNGIDVGVSLFVQGCPLKCKGCFNPETWDKMGGKEFTEKDMNAFINNIDKPFIKRMSILGGEPLSDYNIDTVWVIINKIRERYGNDKNIWLYTGYNMDEILEDSKKYEMIKLVDYLVYGRFIEELKDGTLKFRGSKNQRILDCKATVANGYPIYAYER